MYFNHLNLFQSISLLHDRSRINQFPLSPSSCEVMKGEQSGLKQLVMCEQVRTQLQIERCDERLREKTITRMAMSMWNRGNGLLWITTLEVLKMKS